MTEGPGPCTVPEVLGVDLTVEPLFTGVEGPRVGEHRARGTGRFVRMSFGPGSSCDPTPTGFYLCVPLGDGGTSVVGLMWSFSSPTPEVLSGLERVDVWSSS